MSGVSPLVREELMTPRGRLAGKVALITGAAGNIGEEITRRYLREGATVVMTGRNRAKLDAARERLLPETGASADRAAIITMDGADPEQVRAAVQQAMARYRRLDVIVNNAGSAGPRQKLENIPFTSAELQALRDAGSADTETVGDAARSLLGISWNVVRAAASHLLPGAAVINISTIFSRTQYFGRTAYVVPKAALNAFSRLLAAELGVRGIRVNTVFPGPIESERIRSVFASMDKLKQVPDGSTAREFFELMTLARAVDGGAPRRTFPTVADVANAIVFLGCDESAAINGHNLEITHGMTVRQESRSTFVSRPGLRIVDGSEQTVLVAAGDQVADALVIARIQAGCGARVLLGLGTEDAVRALSEQLTDNSPDVHIHPVLLDRTRPDMLAATLAGLRDRSLVPDAAVILPAFAVGRFGRAFSDATDGDVDAFIDGELCGEMALARELTRGWKLIPPRISAPSVVFVSNGDDGAGNRYADMLRAATEELIRVWRDETEVLQRAGERAWTEWGNQIIRWTNCEEEGLRSAAGWAAKLLYTKRHIRQVNLYLPTSIAEATGARRATFGWAEGIMGLHLGKAVLVTGGSAGIGGQIGRLLALAGARVMLVARGNRQLEETRRKIVEELEAIGYHGAEHRVQVLAGVDVADEAGLELAVQRTLERFGRIDYLVNNAGMAGAEEMVVDMPLADWRLTLDTNLVSNYSLIHKVVPVMKRQASGYILNVSSYFGGEKYVAVPYPNRADYAVSKAGQRALAETLARFVGPEIQITAIAPGPVEGDRLRGVGGKPGLFERRGTLILANRRLNALYAAMIETIREGRYVAAQLLDLVAANEVATVRDHARDAGPLRALAECVDRTENEGAEAPSCGRFLMNASIARKLVARLRQGGYLLRDADGGARFDEAWIAALPVPPEPFFAGADIEQEAEKIRSGVLSMLHLKKMPTEMEVALATVYFMADRAVSGETFQPSGGLQQERSITERELFGGAKPERLAAMRGQTIWLIGEHLVNYLVRAAAALLDQCNVGKVVLLTRTAESAAAIVRELATSSVGRVHTRVVGDDLEVGMDLALVTEGQPSAVVSTPFAPLPKVLFGGAGAASLDARGFRELVEANVTHHFRVARKVSLLDDIRLVLVSPETSLGALPEEFTLANFVKTTLHALTATLSVENERLVHGVLVNQINLTRRVRSEEPHDAAEKAEELDRFAKAVLLAAAPLPDAEDSRYRSKIYRGMAITV